MMKQQRAKTGTDDETNSLELHEHLGAAGILLLAGAALLPMIAREDPFLIIGMISVAVSGAMMLTGKLTDHS